MVLLLLGVQVRSNYVRASHTQTLIKPCNAAWRRNGMCDSFHMAHKPNRTGPPIKHTHSRENVTFQPQCTQLSSFVLCQFAICLYCHQILGDNCHKPQQWKGSLAFAPNLQNWANLIAQLWNSQRRNGMSTFCLWVFSTQPHWQNDCCRCNSIWTQKKASHINSTMNQSNWHLVCACDQVNVQTFGWKHTGLAIEFLCFVLVFCSFSKNNLHATFKQFCKLLEATLLLVCFLCKKSLTNSFSGGKPGGY